MTRLTVCPPFPACAALVVAAALALPAMAQSIQQTAITHSRALTPAPSVVTSLTANLTDPAPQIQNRTWTGLVRNLQIEVLPGPDATTFGVGPDVRCAYGPGDKDDRVVEFHNPTDTYSRGQPIARACPTWGPAKCSRSVTFMGHTFTANRGYPACTGPTETLNVDGYTGSTPTQQAGDTPSTYTPGTPGTFTPGTTPTPRAKTPSNGIFRVRIWGNVCINGGTNCLSLRDPMTTRWLAGSTGVIHLTGYGATFRPGSPHCGPARWPSEAWRMRGGPGYAEYCDITVDVRN